MGAERRLRLFIYARIVVSFLFLVSTLLFNYWDTAVQFENYQSGVTRLMGTSFIFSVVSLVLLKRITSTQFLTNLQVIWDLLFVSLLVLFTGGIHSPFSFLYLLSIMTAGMLLGRRQSLYTASLCGILYGTILDFHYFGYLSVIGLSPGDGHHIDATRLFFLISFNFIVFGLTAFITGVLAERAQLSEEALQRSSIDFSELAQLNSAIVVHSEIGLLTTTIAGRIRVFNPYAESIVGRSLADVYDTPLEAVFPPLADMLTSGAPVSNVEFDYRNQDGVTRNLECNVARFNDRNGAFSGYIINLRDVSALRHMEDALKRADRLAALGELSARLSHEIRNPLAALCGAVQLLSAAPEKSGHDTRLFTIITRESERLNTLISDFLRYARPASPQLTPLMLHHYIEDQFILLRHDPKFSHIQLINSVPDTVVVTADPGQLNQVLINILQNAADAIGGVGTILVEYATEQSMSIIRVTDSGPGIPHNALHHLFEPFWTTKANGTGLGLAVSYRIIEAHGGTLTIESPASGGCRCSIILPVLS